MAADNKMDFLPCATRPTIYLNATGCLWIKIPAASGEQRACLAILRSRRRRIWPKLHYYFSLGSCRARALSSERSLYHSIYLSETRTQRDDSGLKGGGGGALLFCFWQRRRTLRHRFLFSLLTTASTLKPGRGFFVVDAADRQWFARQVCVFWERHTSACMDICENICQLVGRRNTQTKTIVACEALRGDTFEWKYLKINHWCFDLKVVYDAEIQMVTPFWNATLIFIVVI